MAWEPTAQLSPLAPVDNLSKQLGEIASTLESIPTLVEAVPSEDDFDGLGKELSAIEGLLESIPNLVEALPMADDLKELEHATASIADNLATAGAQE